MIKNNKKLKLKRIELGLTQDEFTKKLKIGKNRVVSLEKGDYENLRLREMKKIAQVLNSTIEELFLNEC